MRRVSGVVVSLSAFVPTLSAQAGAGNGVQWFPGPQIEAKREQAKAPWLPLLDTPTLLMGCYRLPAGSVDGQSPHEHDEIYHVLAGKAKLVAGGETRAVQAGDAVFVAARVPHHFVDIEADLDVLVMFSKARGTTGGMAAAKAAPTEQTPYAETSVRGNARIFYWFGPDSAGQVSIDFGRPRWRPAYEKFLQQPGGPRWRFGENFWTSLDTNMPLELGGVAVEPGSYYLVLEHSGEQGPQLVLLDPQEVRRRRLDAYEAQKTKGGLVVPLLAGEGGAPAEVLDVELVVDGEHKDRGELRIRFGPHLMTAPLVMKPRR